MARYKDNDSNRDNAHALLEKYKGENRAFYEHDLEGLFSADAVDFITKPEKEFAFLNFWTEVYRLGGPDSNGAREYIKHILENYK